MGAAARLRVGLGAALVVGPVAAGVLVLTGAWHVEGGHGLAAWFAVGACFLLALVGTSLCALAAWRSPTWRPLGIAMACLGGAALVAFLVAYGMPFGR